MFRPSQRIACLMLAVLLIVLSLPALAEMPSPTISPNAEPYDANSPEALEEDQLAATAALVMEESTGNIIFAKNIDDPLYPASTTKIMTVLLGILTCDMDEVVTVTRNAVTISDPDATTMGLKEGEEILMEDLLYGTLLRSGNDGAIAIAEHVSGSVPAFVDLMNNTAAAYGMTKTHFTNPHGLHDPNHFSTARDLALLAREAMSNETFRKIAGTTTHSLAKTNISRQRSVETRHRIMLPTYHNEPNKYYYAPITGIKSGSHSQAAYCYVGSASRDGVDLISVVLYSGYYEVWRDTKKLMEYGFSQFQHITIAELYEKNPIKVYTSGFSRSDTGLGELILSCSPVNPLAAAELTATQEEIDALAANLRNLVMVEYTRDLIAPITAGEVIGIMTYTPPNGEPVEYNLLATRSIPKREDAPLSLEEIVRRAEADPNPFPPLSVELVLILLSPFIIFALVILIIRFLVRRYKRRFARLPRNSNRYVK